MIEKIILSTLLAIGLLFTPQVQTGTGTGTGHPYYPMSEGLEIHYQAYNITARYYPSTQRVGILSRTPTYQIWRIHTTSECAGLADLPIYTYVTNAGTMPFFQSWGFGLTTNGNIVQYLGEIAHFTSTTSVVLPPKAQITLHPVEGERMELAHTVYQHCNDMTVQFQAQSTYTTQQHYDIWGNYSDVWVTSLLEHNGSNNGGGHIYMYAFARDIGLVDLWHGVIDPATNMLVNGQEFYAIPSQFNE